VSTLQPDRPRMPPIPPGTEACGCCEGVEHETPRLIFNRSGLSSIEYRVGTYTQFVASLHAGLSSSKYPALANLRTRSSDDFTIALLDAVACTADVLTFYQERIANESYLRTATERISLEEMGRLTGHRLRPGVAAETWLAFSMETPPVPPAAAKPEPGTFVTGVPKELTIDAGLAVRSVPGPGETSQVFETVAPVKARAQWNAMRPWLDQRRGPAQNDRFTYLRGVATHLKAGDALLILGSGYLSNTNADHWALRILDNVELQAEQDRTRVTWKEPLPSSFVAEDLSAQVWALRKRASIYGHNAPSWAGMSTEFKTGYQAVFGNSPYEWPKFVISPIGATTTGGWIDLDLSYPDVTLGSYVVLRLRDRRPLVLDPGVFTTASAVASAPTPAFGGGSSSASPAMLFGPDVSDLVLHERLITTLFKVADVAEASREEFALSGKVTRLRLQGTGYAAFEDSVRATTVFARSEPLDIAPYPLDDVVIGATIPLEIGVDALEEDRPLLVRGIRVRDGIEVTKSVTLVSATTVAGASPPRTVLEVDPPLSEPLTRSSVIVYGNVARASHGETVAQVLGSGDGSQPFQRFELKQLPLTWRSAVGELGVAAQVTVRVNDVAWELRDTMYGAGAEDRAYTLQTDEQGRSFVQFGDGERGARVPSGSNNVRVRYRKGIGAGGNVGADTLTQAGVRPLGLKGVSNPIRAEGGADAESPDQARSSMPLGTRTLGRAVSVLDYEDFARAYPGVAKAQARVLSLPVGRAVVITIVGPDNEVISPESPVWKGLQASLAASGDPHVIVRLLPHRRSTFQVGLKIKLHPDYERDLVFAAVEAALRTRFGFDARDLGQPVQESEVIAVAQGVPGVVAVDLDLLYGGTEPPAQTQPPRHVRLLAGSASVKNGIAVAAELLTLDPLPLARLEEMR
jgi:hypothetical protein